MTALAIAALSMQAFAVNYTHSLLVNFNSGETMEFQFEDYPVVTFSGENLTVKDDAGANNEILVADVKNLTFGKTETGIEQVADDADRVTVAIDSEYLAMGGLAAGQTVNIYSVAGMLRASGTVGDDGSVKIGIASLEQGVYVVSSNSKVFKFVKK